MAHIWLARLQGKRGFEKQVAIKTIKPEFSSDPSFETMFLDEARIASMVQHPNVAQIIDLGESDGVLYLVLEYVDGESLSRVRQTVAKSGDPFPLGIALRIMADTCAGLHAAHELRDERGQNLHAVHRDVSPQNILVSTRGAAKLLDFGIAKAANRLLAETGAGTFKGKVHYMPPEQALGGAVDRRVDVWAVGACLYHLIAGRKPYDPLRELDVIRNLAAGKAPPPVGGDVPEMVQSILEACLAPDVSHRFESAAALQRAVEGALGLLRTPTTHDDVAAFMQHYVGELAEKRRKFVAFAMERAAARAQGMKDDDHEIVNEAALPPSSDHNTRAGYHAPSAPLPAAGAPARAVSAESGPGSFKQTQYAQSPNVAPAARVDLKSTQYEPSPVGQQPPVASAPTFPAALHGHTFVRQTKAWMAGLRPPGHRDL